MSEQIDRRSFLARSAATGAGLAAVGVGGGLLDACSSGSGSGSGSGGASAGNGVSSATPKPGGHLTFGVNAEEKGFNPVTATFDSPGINYARTVFDPLGIIAADGTVKPYLAQSITPNSDYTSWVITLRPNVVFHDGTACDGAALLYNLQAQKAGLLTGPALDNVDTISQTGPLSVTVGMKQPWVPFDYYLAGGVGGQVAFVAAPSMLKNADGTRQPVGTGPFVFQQWVENSHFTATKNAHYWRKGMPYLDGITFKAIPDPDQLMSSLESGSVDLIHNDTASVTKQLRGNSSFSYVDDSTHVAGEPNMGCTLLNLSTAPFDNLKVRQACALAMSSEEFVKVIDMGQNPPSTGPFVSGSPFYAPTGYPKPDLAKAKQLIQEVEQETGAPVSFTLGSTPDPSTVKNATFVQNQFQAAGMKVSLSQIQQADIINTALVGKFQALIWGQFGAVDPDLNYIFWSPTQINSAFSINMARNTDPAMEVALQKGRQSSDPSVRAQAYQEVGRLLAKNLPYIWSDRTVWMIAAKPNVQNFNNPTTPEGGKAYGMISGAIWTTQIWLGS